MLMFNITTSAYLSISLDVNTIMYVYIVWMPMWTVFMNFLTMAIPLPHVCYNGISNYLLNSITNQYYVYTTILSV